MPLAPLSPGHQRSFKARPLNKRVMESAGDLGVPRIARAAPTAVSEFKFGTSVRKEAPEKSKEVEVPLFSSFASAPLRRSTSFTPRAAPAASPARVRPASLALVHAPAEKSKEVELPLYSSFAPAPVRRSTSFTPRPATAPSASKPAAAKPATAKPAAAKPTAAKLAAAKPAAGYSICSQCRRPRGRPAGPDSEPDAPATLHADLFKRQWPSPWANRHCSVCAEWFQHLPQ